MDIIEIFWDNVEWHMNNKKMNLRKSHDVARRKRAGINLRTVGEIAKCLGIDDYSILFEEVVQQ